MSEWKEHVISDLCSAIIDCVNKTAPISPTPTPYQMLRTSDVRGGFINLEGLNCVTEEVFAKWTRRGLLEEGDVIFTREAPLGEAAIVRDAKNYFLGQRLILYRANPEVCDNRFLLYWFLNPINKEGLKTRGVGSTVAHMRVPECERIKVTAPSLKTQQRIADILSAYDALIETNQRQIKLLEEAAQRLYKEWFVDLRYPGHEDAPVVDGVPEGWIACVLDDVIEFNPKISLNKDRVKQCVPMAALSTQSMILNSGEFTETTSTSGSKFQNGDTLLARITPCLENGKTGFVAGLDSDEGAVGSTEFIVMRSKRLNPYMVYLLARTDDFRKTAINSMTGSDGRQRAQPGKIRAYPFLLPPDSIIDSFGDIVKPIFDTIQKRNQQNAQLSEARDRLLPKLMSGEIAV